LGFPPAPIFLYFLVLGFVFSGGLRISLLELIANCVIFFFYVVFSAVIVADLYPFTEQIHCCPVLLFFSTVLEEKNRQTLSVDSLQLSVETKFIFSNIFVLTRVQYSTNLALG